MIKLTERDKQIIKFVEDFKVVDTTTLARIFFNSKIRVCQNRLKKLKDNNFLKSMKTYYSFQNVFYVNKKPESLIQHNLILSQLIGKLYENNFYIEKYKTSYKIANVIADCFIAIKTDNHYNLFFVEVENTKKFDIKKYLKLIERSEFKEKFKLTPEIVVVTDKPVATDKSLNITTVKTDFSDIENLLEVLKK